MDGLDETVDPPYLVPTHLGEGQSIGPIPVRAFYVVLATGLPILEPRALYRVPTLNLETAAAETRRGERAKWGSVLNGLPHPIQIVIRGAPVTTLSVLERIKAHGSFPALEFAAWLGDHLHGAQLV